MMQICGTILICCHTCYRSMLHSFVFQKEIILLQNPNLVNIWNTYWVTIIETLAHYSFVLLYAHLLLLCKQMYFNVYDMSISYLLLQAITYVSNRNFYYSSNILITKQIFNKFLFNQQIVKCVEQIFWDYSKRYGN